jgi:integrase
VFGRLGRTCQEIPQHAKTNSIVQYILELKKNGRKETTQKTVFDRLTLIAKHCNIDEPEEVKIALTKLKWQDSTKHTACLDYRGYLRFIGKTWVQPKYTPQEKIYFIPTEQEIDQLIASSGKIAPLLQMLKETGARIGELAQLEWTDVDLEHKTVSINHPEKRSLPRILPISEKLKNMLQAIPKATQSVFCSTTTQHGLRINFEATRERTAKKLANPRLLKIHFHTFRHYKGTMTYHDMHDSYDVRRILGHKTATMTDRYINIEKGMWMNDEGQWICKIAQDQNEEIQLNEKAFQYVRTLADGKPLYRKRK